MLLKALFRCIFLIVALLFTSNLAAEDLVEEDVDVKISEESCNACHQCRMQDQCFHFPGMGSLCAQENPCEYYKCGVGKKCEVKQKLISYECPNGEFVGAVPEVDCVKLPEVVSDTKEEVEQDAEDKKDVKFSLEKVLEEYDK